MSKQNMTLTDLRVLQELLGRAQRDLERYINPAENPADELCHVPVEARKASASYLDSWVGGPLDQALKLIGRNLDRVSGDE